MSQLQQKTIKGFLWNVVSAVGKGGLNFLVMMVLARFLPLKDFALFALIVAVNALSEIFIDCGFGQAIIRTKNNEKAAVSTLFWLNVIIAAVIYLLLFVLTEPFVRFFSFSEYVWPVRIGFLVLLFDAAAMVQSALFMKSLNFKPITLSLVFACLIAAALSLTALLLHFGVWCLIIFSTASSLFRCVFLWYYSTWRPDFTFQLKKIKEYFHFGSFLFLLGIVDHAFTCLETMLIGRFFTKADLAYVARAKDLNSQVNQSVLPLFFKVIYPALVTIQEDETKMVQTFRKVLTSLQFCTFLLIFFLIASADNIIPVLYGEKWCPAVPYLRIVCIAAVFYPAQLLFCNLYLLKNRTDLYFYVSMIRQIIRLIVISACVCYTVDVFVWGSTGVCIFGSFILIFFAAKLIQYRLTDLLKDCLPITLIVVISSLLVFGVNQVLPMDSKLIRLIIQMGVMGASYFGLAMIFHERGFFQMIDILKSRLRKTT